MLAFGAWYKPRTAGGRYLPSGALVIVALAGAGAVGLRVVLILAGAVIVLWLVGE